MILNGYHTNVYMYKNEALIFIIGECGLFVVLGEITQ